MKNILLNGPLFCSALLVGALYATSGECKSGTGWLQNADKAFESCADVDGNGEKFQCGMGKYTTDEPGPGNCTCNAESKKQHADLKNQVELNQSNH